jgi:hypothetical protein
VPIGDRRCADRGIRGVPIGTTQGTNRSTHKNGPICASQSSAPPLALVAPISKTKRAASRRPPKGTPDPNVTVLRNAYVQAFTEAKGIEPKFSEAQWGRAMRAFKELLEATRSPELAKTIIRRALADEWQRKNGCQPWEIVRDMNKFVGAQPTRKANGRTPVQPNYGVDIKAEVVQG